MRRIGIEQIAARGSGEGAEGHRRIGRAEGREPHFGDRFLLRGGGDGERVHVGELALVGRHAGGGVALDVLDRAHALLHRKLDVLDADVVLEVDEGLDAAVAEDMQRRAERRRRKPAARRRRRRSAPRGRRSPPPRRPRARPRRPRRGPRRDRRSALQAPADRSRWTEAPGRNTCSASSNASLPRDCEKRWTEGVQPPDIRSASQGIVRMPPGCAARRTASTRWRPVTSCIAALVATRMPAARAASGSGPEASSRRSAISSTSTPASLQVERGAIGAVVRGDDDDALADFDAVLDRDSAAPRRRA